MLRVATILVWVLVFCLLLGSVLDAVWPDAPIAAYGVIGLFVGLLSPSLKEKS